MRTQEFSRHWSPSSDEQTREILRHQYRFSPISSEVEDYHVKLGGVRLLELRIYPAVGQPDHFATLTKLRLR